MASASGGRRAAFAARDATTVLDPRLPEPRVGVVVLRVNRGILSHAVDNLGPPSRRRPCQVILSPRVHGDGDMNDFAERFRQLTGHEPLKWQTRLYKRFVAESELPKLIDLPTGLGKTMVMAIWLIARAETPEKIPTRLIYVVDRRTVVDQATDLAMSIRDNAEATLGLDIAISTLRGQLADNREWSQDPTRPAIIIGTVDLIGSALLFSGYRSSYKRRPLEAGLLGQDALLVLDEAHLSKPFDKLLGSIEHFSSRGAAIPSAKPLKVVRMSATSSSGNGDRFTLESSDLQNTTIMERFTARKTLTITTLGEKDNLNNKLADAAIALATREDLKGKRIVVFVRKPESARDIAERIRKKREYADSVEVLTGTMRGLERDELVEKPVMKRFLDGDIDPKSDANQTPVFLISTSAGEVGFDLNADHMVCDATTIDSLIQRLGRVNRRGLGDAKIVLIRPKALAEKNPSVKTAIEQTLELLPGTEGKTLDVSPKNIADLKSGDWKDKYADACSPVPTMVELTDILLDNWSMTSIDEPMPGRPPVDPWLRGIADWEPPRTEVAWRAELDLEGFAGLEPADIEEWFDTHRILTHETLSEKTSEVASWFRDRQKAIPESEWNALAERPVIIDRAGLEVLSLGEVINRLSRGGNDADAFLRGAELLVPASFGGIERGKGLLDAAAPEVPKDEDKKPADEQAHLREQRRVAPDVADLRGRYREIVETNQDGESVTRPLVAGQKPLKAARFTLTLETDDDKTVKLISYIPKFEKLDTGQKPQSLEGHVKDVRKRADDIIKALALTENDPVRLALELAADFHDHGKNRERWQRLLIFPPSFKHPGKPMAKSGGEMRRDPRGYRHEFGSLREFADAFTAGQLLDHSGTPITQEAFDLAMHLIATHHGRGRPHFPKGGFDPDAEDRSDQIHTDAIRRFARLQRTYGWWGLAWLENLLRCADALASAAASSDTEEDETEELA